MAKKSGKSKADIRSYVRFKSSESPHCYYLSKNKRNTPERMELKKYDPVVRRHVIYKEEKK